MRIGMSRYVTVATTTGVAASAGAVLGGSDRWRNANAAPPAATAAISPIQILGFHFTVHPPWFLRELRSDHVDSGHPAPRSTRRSDRAGNWGGQRADGGAIFTARFWRIP